MTPRLAYPIGLMLAASACNIDSDRTEYAQRKAGRGIRSERILGRLHIVRLNERGAAFPITTYQLRRFS